VTTRLTAGCGIAHVRGGGQGQRGRLQGAQVHPPAPYKCTAYPYKFDAVNRYTCPARETLVLKEGATVILLRNLSAGVA
jgi:hypothetical protein